MATKETQVDLGKIEPTRTEFLKAKHIGYTIFALFSLAVGWAIVRFNYVIVLGVVGVTVMSAALLYMPFLGVLVYLVFEYARLTAMFPALQALQLGKLIVLPTLLALILHYTPLRTMKFKWDSMYWLFLGWLTLAFMSTILALDKSLAFDAATDLAKWFIVSFIIANLLNSLPKWQIGMWTLLMLNFKLSQFQIRDYMAGIQLTDNRDYFIAQGVGAGGSSFFGNATDFGFGMVIVVPLAFYMLLSTRSKILKVLSAIITGAFVFSLLNSGSRGAAVALFAMAGFYWFLSKRKVLSLVLIALFIGGFWLTAPEEWRHRFESGEDYQQDATANQRLDLWTAGLKMFMDHPLLGVGINNYPINFVVKYKPVDYVGANVCHNVFIQAMSELGIGGLTLVIIVIFFVFKKNYQTRKVCKAAGVDDHWFFNFSYALDMSMLGYIVGGFFLTVLYYPHLYIIVGFTMALNKIALDTCEKRAHREVPSPA